MKHLRSVSNINFKNSIPTSQKALLLVRYTGVWQLGKIIYIYFENHRAYEIEKYTLFKNIAVLFDVRVGDTHSSLEMFFNGFKWEDVSSQQH
jgi:hypothetical protein